MKPFEIMHIALGGCLRGTPLYGLTEDTGGHITYILGEARAMARRADVSHCEIVTRLFDDARLGAIHAQRMEQVAPKLTITRIDSGNRHYLAKEALAEDRAAFTCALIKDLRGRDRLPDAIHAHFSDAADVALRVREALGVPVIYTPHSLGRDKLASGCANPADLADRLAEEDRAIGGADAVIASSRDECERQIASYPSARVERVWRVHPGIEQTPADAADRAAARQLIAPFLRASDKPIILAIARPVRKKNLAGLVKAFGQHEELRERANLVILPGLRQSLECGEPEQVEVLRELVDLIDQYDLHGHVAYPRQHDLGTVRGLYALAAEGGGVFCNPAMFEPFGLTILEAAAHHLPVVATCRGGASDIVGELQHGMLVDPTDPTALAQALHRMVGDEMLRAKCVRNAARNIREVTWDRYAEQALSIMREVTGARLPMRTISASDRLLLCDIDNTLTGCRHSIAELSDYLRRNPNIGFGVATGRSLPEARRLVQEWNLPQPRVWITSVGSEIYWQGEGEIRPDDDYAEIIAEGWDAERITRFMQGYRGIRGQSGIEQRRFKRSYFCADGSLVERLRADLARAGIRASVIYSHGRLLDILPQMAGKGAAARHVAARLGVPRANMIVAGDSGNDEDLIHASRNPILVANSEPALIAAGRAHGGAYFAKRSFAGGVLEGLMAITETKNTRSAA